VHTRGWAEAVMHKDMARGGGWAGHRILFPSPVVDHVPLKSRIWSIFGKLSRSAVHFDRILTESGFWATNFGTLPAEGVRRARRRRQEGRDAGGGK
jgi:hypothetical protein